MVYSHKRHGQLALGGRTYDFRMKPAFPKKLSREFLLVDLVNNLDRLGESADEVLERVRARLAHSDSALEEGGPNLGLRTGQKVLRSRPGRTGVQDAA